MKGSSRTKMLTLAAVIALMGAILLNLQSHPALAMQPMPDNDWSFYMRSSSTSEAYTLGCNQGTNDASYSPPLNSEVVLDFGGQLSDGSGTELINGTYATNAQIEAIAEQFVYGCWECVGIGDNTSVLRLGIGTNNSNYDVSSSGGDTWAQVVAIVASYTANAGYSSQISVGGANDMEPIYDDASDTRAWVNGFANAAPNGFYVDYGSAGGCPEYSASNGPCNDGWTQDDVYYVSWGTNPSFALPEIYNSAMANEWAMISLYGAQTYGYKIDFDGPLDEYDLDSSTNSPSDAWNQLWTALNNNSATAVNMPYSAEMHNEPT